MNSVIESNRVLFEVYFSYFNDVESQGNDACPGLGAKSRHLFSRRDNGGLTLGSEQFTIHEDTGCRLKSYY